MAGNLTPRRHLDLEGAHNVRDIGGYPTADGRRTRWKTFLRADSLHRLPLESQACLLDYGVRTVIDLRRTQEVEMAPNVFAGSSDVAYLHHNMVGDMPLGDATESVEVGVPAQRILKSYSTILDHRHGQIRETMATLSEPGSQPVLYHCAAGKDRTGMISALLLGIAGVPNDTIVEDYALTAKFLLDRYFADQSSLEPPALEIHTWQDYQREFCPPEAMLLVLQHLDKTYGGIEGYVRTIGLSGEQIERLRGAIVE